MGWSGNARRLFDLQELPELVFVVRTVTIGVSKGTTTFGVASHEGIEGTVPGLVAKSVRVTGSSLSMRTWAGTAGGFEFTLPTLATGNVLSAWGAGTVLELKAGMLNVAEHAWPRIAVGWLDSITAEPNEYRFRVLDLASLLQSRFSARADRGLLFYNLPTDTNTTVSSVASTDVTLGDASTYEQDAAGVGAFQTSSGTQYQFDGKTGNTLHNVKLIDGTAGTPATSTAVRPLAYLRGHPVRIALRLLNSSGALNTSGIDTLPESWGYDIPSGVIDDKYTIATIEQNIAKNLPNWHVIVSEPVDNGWSFIKSFLNPAGLFLDQRQGELIISAVQTPHLATKIETDEIDDFELIRVQADLYDPQTVGEYANVYVDHDGTGASLVNIFGTPTANDIGTLPVLGPYTIDVSEFAPDALTSSGDKTDLEGDLEARIARFYTRRGERLHVTCAGFKFAGMHRGQVLRVSTSRIRGRLPKSLGRYDRLEAMIVKHSVDWSACRVMMQLVALPPDEGRTYKRPVSAVNSAEENV